MEEFSLQLRPAQEIEELQIEANISEIRLGGGFTQKISRGTQAMRRQWQVKWQYLSADEADEICNFLSLHKGVHSFSWSPDDRQHYLVSCHNWRQISAEGDYWHIHARFEAVTTLAAS